MKNISLFISIIRALVRQCKIELSDNLAYNAIMNNISDSKLRLLYLRQMLWDETSAETGLSMNDILARLKRRGIICDKKSVYDDIRALKGFGLGIKTGHGKNADYRLVGRRPIPASALQFDRGEPRVHIPPSGRINVVAVLVKQGQIGRFLKETAGYNSQKTSARTVRLEILEENKFGLFLFLLRYRADAKLIAPAHWKTEFKDFLWEVLREY